MYFNNGEEKNITINTSIYLYRKGTKICQYLQTCQNHNPLRPKLRENILRAQEWTMHQCATMHPDNLMIVIILYSFI